MPVNKPRLRYLIFYVTSRCNLRCKHCFYLDELNKREEMTLEEIEKLARHVNPLTFVRMTGGEPFLRKDIAEVVSRFYHDAQTRRMGIITNGTRPEWVVERTEAMLERCPNLSLDIGVSVDGLEEVHDDLRGLKGSFKKAKESALALIQLKKHFPRLQTSLVTTITARNESTLDPFYQEIAGWGVDRLSVNHVRGKVHDESLKEISYETYLNFAARCETYHLERETNWKAWIQRGKNRMTRKAIEQVVADKKYAFPCLAGSAIGVLYSDGELYLCELFDGPLPNHGDPSLPSAHARLGNVREVGCDFYSLWHSPEAQQCRDWIQQTNCSCSHECFLTASIYFNKRNYPRLLKETAQTLISR
jgi:MoaA/NifB/PqqE/SkfB family radical SAM enzyme